MQSGAESARKINEHNANTQTIGNSKNKNIKCHDDDNSNGFIVVSPKQIAEDKRR